MRRVTVFAVLALIALSRGGPLAAPASHAAEAPDEITASTVTAVRTWVTAVETHVPGQRDAAVDMCRR